MASPSNPTVPTSGNGYFRFHRLGFTKSAILAIFRNVRDITSRVRTYLAQRVEWEPNPYYKGRYQVALLVMAYNHVAHPYEVAEVLFRASLFAKKIELWLQSRCERFPYFAVKFDGTLGDWLPPKKSVQSSRREGTQTASCPESREPARFRAIFPTAA